MIALVGCARPAPEAVTVTPTTTASDGLEGKLLVLARPGQVERGAVDPRFDWVTAYERETGCKLAATLVAGSDELVAAAAQGGFDVITAPGDAALRLIRAGRVQPVDLGKVPSFANVDPRLRQAPWHFVDGRHYGTPLQWAPNVLMYSRKAFPVPPTSWSVVFETRMLGDGRNNAGRVQAYRGAIYLADAALYLMTHEPTLGIRDPYELDETQYAAVLELLRRQRPLVHRYWSDPDVAVQDFAAGTVVASGSWPLQVNRLAAVGEPVASAIPAEGMTGWADTVMLAKDAKHPNCAHRWMEWTLNANVQGDMAAWLGAVPAVPAACERHALLGDSGCARNGRDHFERIRFWRAPEAACGTGICVPYERWAVDYAAITAGR